MAIGAQRLFNEIDNAKTIDERRQCEADLNVEIKRLLDALNGGADAEKTKPEWFPNKTFTKLRDGTKAFLLSIGTAAKDKDELKIRVNSYIDQIFATRAAILKWQESLESDQHKTIRQLIGRWLIYHANAVDADPEQLKKDLEFIQKMMVYDTDSTPAQKK